MADFREILDRFRHLNPKKAWPHRRYILFGLFAFLLFFYFGFPLEKARPIIERKLETQLRKALRQDVLVQFGELDTYWFSGLRADRLDIRLQRGDGTPHPIRLTNVRLRLNLLPFIFKWGEISLYLATDALRGSISGTVGWKKDHYRLNMKANRIELQEVVALLKEKLMGIQLKGALDMDIDLDWHTKEVKLSEGNANIRIEKPTVLESKVLFVNLPQINLEKFNFAVVVKNGTAKVAQCTLDGEPMNAKLTGNITLAKRLGQSRANLKLKTFFSEELKSQIPSIEALLSSQRADSAGNYTFTLSGPLGRALGPIGLWL